ncbi:unnamed protein product, partial [Musa textilis]
MKLVVEVVDAHDLMPKDGEGSSSAFVEVDFGNQRSRTRTVHKDLNPVWNQKLSFRLDDPDILPKQSVEACVYNERKSFPGRNFLGRVRVHGANIVRQGEEILQRFHLEKKWLFSSVKGDLALKLYVFPEPKSPPPLPPSPTNHSCPTSAVTESDTITSKTTVTNSTIDPAAPTETLAVERTSLTTNPKPATTEEAELNQRPTEVKLETTYCINKHQVSPQLGKSVEQQSPATVPVVPIMAFQQVHYGQAQPSRAEEYKLKDTSPQLGERWPHSRRVGWMGMVGGGDKLTSTYDLVEQTYYLYVRVVKAKDLPPNAITGSCDPYVEVKLGNYKGITKHFDKKSSPEWNQAFAFSKERIQSTVLEVYVKDKEVAARDDYIGRVVFDLNEVPTRVPPDSPLAPQWYRLEDRRGDGKVRGEIMLAVWMGTQADEAFPDAWHSDAATVHGEGVSNIRSKVYVSPKLWYLRVNVIEAQDVQPNDGSRPPEVFVKAQVGNQVLKTRVCPTRTMSPMWNEDLIFVAAEPFEEHLVLTVEDRVHHTKDDLLGRIVLPLTLFEKRLDHRPVHSRWFNMERFGFGVLEGDRRKELKFSSRIHLRVCLEGAYHVMDESTMYISDTRPTARQLWKQPIGVLEVGILSAQGLIPMKLKDGRGTTDAYCVAKYGQKWVRTRTIIDSASPKWNEQYTWEVYDPCTVITLGVFDNCHLGGNEKPAGGGGAAR